jgi:uncharacterized protein (DUF1501 family)
MSTSAKAEAALVFQRFGTGPADLRSVLKALLKDHLRVEESVLAGTVFPDSAGVVPTAGLVG